MKAGSLCSVAVDLIPRCKRNLSSIVQQHDTTAHFELTRNAEASHALPWRVVLDFKVIDLAKEFLLVSMILRLYLPDSIRSHNESVEKLNLNERACKAAASPKMYALRRALTRDACPAPRGRRLPSILRIFHSGACSQLLQKQQPGSHQGPTAIC